MTIDDDVLKNIGNIRSNGNLLPPPVFKVSPVFQLPDGNVVVIEVIPSENPPVKYNGKIYVRVGPRQAVANESEERILIQKRTALAKNWDARPAPISQLSDLNISIIELEYIPQAISRDILSQNHREIEQKLASLRLFDLNKNCPSNAGLLFFGIEPLQFFPGAYVQFLKVDSRELDLDKVSVQKEFRGPLYEVLRSIESFVTTNLILSKPVRISGSMRDTQVYNYPYDSLRELIMNAFMHRDYESNAPIRITQLLDRIEINNPGGLYGDARPDNFPNVSDYRNPVLAEIMKTLGYINRFNFGIIYAQKKLIENGNPAAEFTLENLTQFQVTVKINPSWI